MKLRTLLFISTVILLTLGCGLLDRTTNNARPTAVVRMVPPTSTPMPTFTPTPPLSAIMDIPPTATIAPTNTPAAASQPAPTDTPVPTPTPVLAPRVSLAQTVNVRTGPGTAYPRIGEVTNGYTADILGRNNDGSWVQINYSGGQGWVFASLTQITGDVNNVPVVDVAPPPPPPATSTPTPVPPTPVPAGPQYPYKIHNIFSQPNGAITQIRGYIQDANGNPVNGVRVRVRSGSFCTISVPSGTVGVYQQGNYDVLLDNKAKPGAWQVAIVDRPTDPQDTKCDAGAQQLSEEVTVNTSTQEGVVFVEFDKVR